jgi:hypothetical protein
LSAVAAALAAAAPAANPRSTAQAIDAQHSTLIASFQQQAVTVDAPFKRFDGSIHYDPAHAADAHATLHVDTSSLDVGDDDSDAEVRGASWFDCAHFPTATFESTRITTRDAQHFDATGNLTIKGRTRPDHGDRGRGARCARLLPTMAASNCRGATSESAIRNGIPCSTTTCACDSTCWPTAVEHRMKPTENRRRKFAELGLSEPVLQALAAVGYEAPSPIQAATIPTLLAGTDVLGQAQTGTGKTAAFALPILSRLDLRAREPQALVLVPTRELAIQVAEAFKKYASQLPGFHVLPIYGGQSYTPQLQALKRGAHVIVGTPGRVMDHLERGALTLDRRALRGAR